MTLQIAACPETLSPKPFFPKLSVVTLGRASEGAQGFDFGSRVGGRLWGLGLRFEGLRLKEGFKFKVEVEV